MIAKIARSRMMLHRNPFQRNIAFSLFAGSAIARAKRPVICDGPSLGRKRCESFAASRAYDVSTRQVVAIHTQYRQKVAAPLNDLLKSNFVVDIDQPG
jgi:hypothetical protein